MKWDSQSLMSTRNPKLLLFAQFAAVAKSLAHAHRLELLEQLAQGERSVEVLAERTGMSVANASQHLQQMRRGGGGPGSSPPVAKASSSSTRSPTKPCSTSCRRCAGLPSKTSPRWSG